MQAFGTGPRPTVRRLVAYLQEDRGVIRGYARSSRVPAEMGGTPAVMWPAPGPPATWPVPAVTTAAELADWLGLTPGELEWFADIQGRERHTPPGPLRHYRYAWRAKATGSARLIESPKPRLKTIQRTLLDQILGCVPAHDAAHGFRRGRSVRSFVEPHVGQIAVLKMDLRDFFLSVGAGHVVAVFMTAGYPEGVARLLAGLCTNRAPRDAWNDPACPVRGVEIWRSQRLASQPHLPQGAPTSPALANLAAYRLDCRLAALAAAAGACYTRYADDLAFSGGADFRRSLERFAVRVHAIAIEEGFAVNPRKTRRMSRSTRQRVAGVVVNSHPNVARDEYDRLKATLHNCVRHGPNPQNREGVADFRAHLQGRVAHVSALNPQRGARLRALFDAIDW